MEDGIFDDRTGTCRRYNVDEFGCTVVCYEGDSWYRFVDVEVLLDATVGHE